MLTLSIELITRPIDLRKKKKKFPPEITRYGGINRSLIQGNATSLNHKINFQDGENNFDYVIKSIIL